MATRRPMEIREACTADLDEIVELWKEFMEFHRQRDPFFTRSEDGDRRFRDFVAENLDNPDWLVLVAIEAERPVGYCMATVLEYPPVLELRRHGFVQDTAVTEVARRHGVGSALYERTERWFRERGITRVELNVAATNDASQAFWRRMGFRDSIHRWARDL
jgi:ribosomal protein S18 acetylase RimI-like enzyme